jgi:predicted RNA-binding Zn-ribbon protein involved in translation (DUF1610 family)
MERPGLSGGKRCPNCGNDLVPDEAPRSLRASRIVATDLLFWVMVALFLTFLGSPRGEGELYAALGSIVLVVWAVMRSRQQADRRQFVEHGRYRCMQCGMRFDGDALRSRPQA